MTRRPFCAWVTALVGALLLTACARPLEMTTDRETLAKSAGVPAEDIQFIDYASFSEAPQGSGRFIKFTKGIVMVTRSSIRFLGGDLNDKTRKVDVEIPFSTMDGADIHHYGLGRELQILRGGTTGVFSVTRNQETVDDEGTQRILDLLLAGGVKPWKSDQIYFAATTVVFVPVR